MCVSLHVFMGLCGYTIGEPVCVRVYVHVHVYVCVGAQACVCVRVRVFLFRRCFFLKISYF